MNKLIIVCLVLFLPTLGFGLTQDEVKKYDELEGLAFIKALAVDKKYESVVKESAYVKPADNEKGEFYYYVGLAYYSLKKFSEAKNALVLNEKYPNLHPDYSLLLARTYQALNLFDSCSKQFEKISKLLIKNQDWVIYTQCLSKNKETDKLLNLFLFTDLTDDDFFLQSQDFLLTHGLTTFANDKRNQFLQSCKSIRNYMELNEILVKNKIKDPRVLEVAHSCHPSAIEITSLLIKSLFNEGKFHSIAYLFEELSAVNPEFSKHTAEFYKVAGRLTTSDYFFLNADEKSYVLSRSSFFLGKESFIELLTFPIDSAIRISNNELGYALSFSAFKVGDNVVAKKIILDQKIKSSKDLALLNLIEKCNQLSWRCRP